MPKFVRKLCLFLIIPLMVNLVAVIFLPVNSFTFRSREALSPHALPFDGPFYPNQQLAMIEEGDLGHDTPYAVSRAVIFNTDRYGYRHSGGARNDYHILIIGDSMIVGSGLTQKDILSEVLSRKLQLGVYPLAPASMQTYFDEPRLWESPPRVLILESLERFIGSTIKRGLCDRPPPRLSVAERPVSDSQASNHQQVFRILADRFLRNPVYLSGFLNSKLTERTTYVGDDDYLFYKPAVPMRSIDEIDRIVDDLVACQELFEEMGIAFVFLPVPDKENIYSSSIPNELQQQALQGVRSTYLRTLIDKLNEADVKVVDTLAAFEAARAEGVSIYQSDDTHWSDEGVRITADLIAELLKTNP